MKILKKKNWYIVSEKFTFNKQIDLKEYEKIVEQSPQGNIFCSIKFLDSIKADYQLWNVKQGNEIKAVMCFTVSKDKKNIILNDLVIYSGIMFNLDDSRLETKKRSDEFKITEFVIENIIKKYKKIEFQLSPFFTDIRPFQWYNYNRKGKKKFHIDVKYTSHLNYLEQNLNDFTNTSLYHSMETVRRYDYRNAVKSGANIKNSNNSDKFMDFYVQLMRSQKIKLSPKMISHLSISFSKLIRNQIGNLFYVYDKNNIVLYSLLYLVDKKRGYYFLGAGGSMNKTSWQSTYGHCKILNILQNKFSINSIDLEGVNSPNRGWFKLSLGGELNPYYKIKI